MRRRFFVRGNTMLYIRATRFAKNAACAALFSFVPALAVHAQTAHPLPVGLRASSETASALVPFSLRLPDGSVAALRLRRLPAAAVVRGTKTATTAKFIQTTATTDPQLYNSELDYSHRATPDYGWFFPTRGYDLRNQPSNFLPRPLSLIYPTDPPYTVGSATYAYDNFGAAIELIQLGQAAQISSLHVSLGVAREIQGNGPPQLNLNTNGGTAVILFWDGVYNETGGTPRSSSGRYKLATDGTGANGVLIQLGPGFADYTINFDARGSQGKFKIADTKGRLGLTIAAVYDPTAGVDGDGLPYSTKEDGVYMQTGAANGQNKYYLISKGNFDIGTPTFDSNGIAVTSSTLQFDPNDPNSDIFGSALTTAVDGANTFQNAPSDMKFNPGEALPFSAGGTTAPVAGFAPYNSSLALYGAKIDGTRPLLGELRGRIRQQGVDPNNTSDLTTVVSPYDPTPTMHSLPLVPGERKMNRFRFTFITPTLSASDIPPATLWNPAGQLPAKYRFFQREVYALPSYGDNADYTPNTPQKGTTVVLNYRLRGIPIGTYSVLAQAIPITDVVPDPNGGDPTVLTDMQTPYNLYPGSDFAPFLAQSVTIGESLFPKVAGSLSNRNYDNYTNPTTLDVKVHRLADRVGTGSYTSDGVVDVLDFGELVNEYGDSGLLPPGVELFDIVGNSGSRIPDGVVDVLDFGELVNEYGLGSPESGGY